MPLPNNLAPDRRARVAQQWEDVLFLEAIHYLGLSKTQIEAMLPLAKAADERLAKLREQEEKKLAVLEPIVQQNREALLLGKTVEHESDAVLHWQYLQQSRAQVEEEIIQYVAPRLVRLLSRPQVRSAYLLARGGALPGEVNSAALLDPSSGFVLNEVTKNHWRETFMKQELARLYPPHVLNADHQALVQAIVQRHSWDADGGLVGPPLTEEEKAIWNLGFKKMDLENEWRERWEAPPGQASEAWTEKEQIWALYHFVRRTFLSSRLTPVLTERAGR